MIISSFVGKVRGAASVLSHPLSAAQVAISQTPLIMAHEAIAFVRQTIPNLGVSSRDTVPGAICADLSENDDWVVVQPRENRGYEENRIISQTEFEKLEKSRRIAKASLTPRELLFLEHNYLEEEHHLDFDNEALIAAERKIGWHTKEQRIIQELEDEIIAEKEQQNLLQEFQEKEQENEQKNLIARLKEQHIAKKGQQILQYLEMTEQTIFKYDPEEIFPYQQVSQQSENETFQQACLLSIQQQQVDQQRMLLKEQDKLYEHSLEMDKIKEEENEMREALKLEEEELAQIEIDNQQLQEAMQLSTQLNEKEKRLRYLKTIQLPLEPILEEPAIHFLISLPNGDKLKRKFHPSETLQVVKYFIDVQALDENGSQQIPTNYIILTDFPRKNLE